MDEVAEVSDALMERYLEGEEISHEEIVAALKDGTNHGGIFPVVCGVATRNLGTNRLLDAIVEDLPVAGEARRRSSCREVTLEPDRGQASCSPTSSRRAPTRSPGASTSSASTRASMKPDTPGAQHAARTPRSASASCSSSQGKETEPRRRVRPRRHRRRGQAQGDARRRLAGRPRRADRRCRAIKLPAPVMAFAIEPKAKGDEDKVFTVAAPPAGGGPDDRPAPRPADRRADRRRPVADPRRGDRRPPEVALRRRGRRSSRRACPTRRRSASRPRRTAATRSRPAAAASSATATSRSSRSPAARASSSSTRSRAA